MYAKLLLKKPPLIHSWKLKKVSIFENQALPVLKIRPLYITLLQKTKNVKIIKQNVSDFLSDQYKIMMTECRTLYRNEEALS